MISIVVPTYKRPKQIIKFLRWIDEAKITIPYEVVIVSNGCWETVKVVEKENISLVVLPRNFYYVKAQNIGISVAKYDLICWISDDFQITQGALEKLLEVMNKNYPKKEGIVGAFSDLKTSEHYFPTGLASRETAYKECGGHFLWPEYLHYYADVEFTERFTRKGLATFVKEAEIIHHRILTDATHKGIEHLVEPDRQLWERRKEKGYPNTYDNGS